MTTALATAATTGVFCAVFAWVVSQVAPTLTLAQVLGVSFVSGFAGSLVARILVRER